ncbi:MAG TPA: NUDIX hydrolase [Chloroflexi bacterium]|nr:NUDIX hydrolase [Chloroflexota bacterium]
MEFKYCPLCATELITQALFGRERQRCPNCRWIHFRGPKVGAGTLVERNGKVVLVKRGVNPGKGLWCFPSGFMEIDEKPQAAAAREFKEETGLDIRITGLVDVFHYSADFKGPGIMVLYKGEITRGDPKAMDDVVEIAFFGPDELPEDEAIAFESNRLVLAQWKKGLSTKSSV